MIVHSLQGEWAKVSIGDRDGYMMQEFLAFGEDMKTVDRHLPSDNEMNSIVENSQEELLFYAEPRTSAKIVADFEVAYYKTGFNFVADIDEEWFQVVFEDGLWCYVQKKFFLGGNG